MVIKEADSISMFGCDGFTALVTLKRTSWCEVEVISEDCSLGGMGGYPWPDFAKNVLAVLKREEGKKLSDISNPRYLDVIGDVSAEFLGEVALSGYNTFYFFRSIYDGSFTIVLANSSGEMLTHIKCPLDAVQEWIRKLEAVIVE